MRAWRNLRFASSVGNPNFFAVANVISGGTRGTPSRARVGTDLGRPTRKATTLAGFLMQRIGVSSGRAPCDTEIGPSAVPALIEALRDDDGGVRAGAAAALGEIGPAAAAAVPALTEALRDAKGEVRVRVAGALGEIGPPLPRPFTP